MMLSTDVTQLTLTLKMTNAQVVETSATVNNDSPIRDYVRPDDQTQPTFETYYCYHFFFFFFDSIYTFSSTSQSTAKSFFERSHPSISRSTPYATTIFPISTLNQYMKLLVSINNKLF